MERNGQEEDQREEPTPAGRKPELKQVWWTTKEQALKEDNLQINTNVLLTKPLVGKSYSDVLGEFVRRWNPK